MRVAYIRVSTAEQNSARQREALENYGIEKWYEEKVSGKSMEREQLKQMLDFVRKGDEIYIQIIRMCRKTPCFSHGDIRHVHRIYASN